MFKLVSGVFMVLAGIILGLYVGAWVCFVGGIAGLIDVVAGAVNGNGISGMDVAINVVKIVFAGLAGWISGIILVLPGVALVWSCFSEN